MNLANTTKKMNNSSITFAIFDIYFPNFHNQ